MSRHDPLVRMRHMLDYAREAVALLKGKTRNELKAERMLHLAVMHLVEIIGEAASRVPKEEQAKYPSLPWQESTTMRNRLVHGYDSINLDILWEIVTNDLPPLIAELEKIVPPEKEK